MKKRRS